MWLFSLISAVLLHRAQSKDFYTKYEHYPDYCSTPEAMAKRRIPMIPEDQRYGKTSIVHASVVIRHGYVPVQLSHVP